MRNIEEIKRLNQAVLQTLQRELIQRPPPSGTQSTRTDVSILTKLLNKRHLLRYELFIQLFHIIGYKFIINFRSQNSIIHLFSFHFREISHMHMEALNRLRSNSIGTLAFPELHNELFPAT